MPVRLLDTIAIRAPRATVWAALTDLACWADWNRVLTAAKGAGEGACLATGAGFTCCLRPFAVPVTFSARVEEAVAPERLLWTVRRLGVHSRHWFRLRDEGDGTVCESDEELSGPLVALAGPLFPAGRLRRLGRAFLGELRDEAERRAREETSRSPAGEPGRRA